MRKIPSCIFAIVISAAPFAVGAQPALNTEGRFDPHWGDQGRMFANMGVQNLPYLGARLLVLPDRKLLLVGGCDTATGDVLCATRLQSTGSFDSSFGPNGSGRAIYDGMPQYGAAPPQIAAAPDGSVFVATSRGLAVSRLGVDGTLQATFHFTYKPDDESPWEEINALTVQPDGKVLAAGFVATVNVVDRPINVAFAVARLLPDLSGLDTSFGNGGVRLIDFDVAPACTDWPCNIDQAMAIAIQADGRIVLAGRAVGRYGMLVAARIAMARLTTAGALDAGFGNLGDGRAVYSFGDPYWQDTTAMALDAQGRVLLTGGYSLVGSNGGNVDIWVARFTATGWPDASFGQYGANWLKLDLGGNKNDHANAIAVQCDGKVLVAGQAASGDLNEFFVARFRVDGTLDSANFSANQGWTAGAFLPPHGIVAAADAVAHSIALGNGGLIVAGIGSDARGDYHFGIARVRLAAYVANGCH